MGSGAAGGTARVRWEQLLLHASRSRFRPSCRLPFCPAVVPRRERGAAALPAPMCRCWEPSDAGQSPALPRSLCNRRRKRSQRPTSPRTLKEVRLTSALRQPADEHLIAKGIVLFFSAAFPRGGRGGTGERGPGTGGGNPFTAGQKEARRSAGLDEILHCQEPVQRRAMLPSHREAHASPSPRLPPPALAASPQRARTRQSLSNLFLSC